MRTASFQESVVRKLYASVTDTHLDREAMNDLATLLGADGVQAIVYAPDSARVPISVSGRVDPAADVDYVRHYHARDFRIRRALQAPPWQVYDDDSFLTAAERRRSPFHQEFLKRYDCERVMLALAPLNDGHTMVLAAARSARRGTFAQTPRCAALACMPHLRAAFDARLHLLRLGTRLRDTQALMDSLDFGVVLLGRGGMILGANTIAARWIARGDGLFERSTRLQFTEPAETARLYAAVNRALRAAADVPVSRWYARVAVPAGVERFVLTVHPLAYSAYAQPSTPAVVLHIMRPGATLRPRLSTLATVHRWTLTETRCAQRLAEGCTVAALAAEMDLSPHTVRAHLRALFAKTGVRRQAELVSRVLSA